MLEIESKFSIPDSKTFARLLNLTAFGDYFLKEPASTTLTDHYLDTSDGAILRGGFACRLRHDHSRNTWTGTLKGLGGAEGEIHKRQEYEVAIALNAPPDQWPASPARDLALELTSGQPVVELFAIHQQRHTRQVVREADGSDLSGGRTIQESNSIRSAHLTGLAGMLSLDRVEFSLGSRRIEVFELEIELAEGGAFDELLVIGRELAAYKLSPQPKSKFERALALFRLQPSFK
jgi:inorganic triphosphatase YgiF